MSQGLYSRKYRVATDTLRPLPLQNSPLPQDWFEREQAQKVKQAVLDVLDKHEIRAPAPFDDLGPKEDYTFSGWETTFATGKENEDYVNIVNRHHPGKPSPVCATIIIQSDWDSSSAQSGPRLPVHVHAVGDGGELAAAWNGRLFKQVMDTLNMLTATKNMVNGLAVSRFGFYYKAEKNPITVYIAVDRRSDETQWSEVMHALQGPLSTFRHQIKVWIEHNNWGFPAFDFDVSQWSSDTGYKRGDWDDYRKKVNLGDEIGMGVYSPCVDGHTRTSGFGTVGCYVKVKKGGKWRTLALTSYHVVRPLFDGFELDLAEDESFVGKVVPKDTTLYKTDHEGIIMTEQGQQLPGIEHPSRRTHMRILGNLQFYISDEKEYRPDSPRQKQLEAQYRDKKRFFDEGKHKFGQLWAASGFMRRSAAGHRMDWALIAPATNRIGANCLPTEATWDRWWRDTVRPFAPDKHTRLRGPSPEATLKLIKRKTLMFKRGAESGPTGAQFSECRGFLGISEARYMANSHQTSEHYIVPGRDGLSLAGSGDSGAVVYNDDGKAVGLIFGGLAPQQSFESGMFPYTYVTPIEDVFADIKAFTGADDVRLLGRTWTLCGV